MKAKCLKLLLVLLFKKVEVTSVVRIRPRSLPKVLRVSIALERSFTKGMFVQSSLGGGWDQDLNQFDKILFFKEILKAAETFKTKPRPINMEMVNVLQSPRHHQIWYNVKFPFQ